VFDEVLRRGGARRLARRASYVAGSTVVQAVATTALAALFASAVQSPPPEPAPVVEVRFVKGAARPALPAPPAPARPLRPTAPPARLARPRPVAALVQPKEVPSQLPPPGPPEPPAPVDPGGAPGVIGGVAGSVGTFGGGEEAARPPGRPAFDPASMTRPVFVSGPEPAYTRAAIAREVEGLMVVACVITREGQVRDCQVQQGLPFMDAAVVQALERRRYRPATLGGEPVEVTYTFRLHLRLPR
jgi:protein TonB